MLEFFGQRIPALKRYIRRLSSSCGALLMAATNEAPARLELAVVERMRDLARDEWNALLAPDDSPFLEWEWLYAMEESNSAARKTGWAPHHFIVRLAPAGRIVGACPMYLKSHSMGEFIFDHGWADAADRAGIHYFPKLLVGVPFTPHTGRRFLVARDFDRPTMITLLARTLAELCRDNGLSSVHVNFCAPDEAEVLRGLGYLERLGYQYHWQNGSFETFDDYLGQLKSKRRYAIRHERAALREQEVSIRVHAGDEIRDAMFGSMFKIYLSTIQKLYWGRQYLTRDFFELLRKNFKRHLRFVCAYRRGELIAGTINLEKAGVLYGRYWGCFTDLPFLHFNVCYYAAIEHCIERRISRFEPGAGGEYKWLRGFDPAPTRSMHYIAHSGLRKAIANFLARERREVQAWITEGRDRSQLKPIPPSNEETD
jgi:predicted N-acyltransferase